MEVNPDIDIVDKSRRGGNCEVGASETWTIASWNHSFFGKSHSEAHFVLVSHRQGPSRGRRLWILKDKRQTRKGSGSAIGGHSTLNWAGSFRQVARWHLRLQLEQGPCLTRTSRRIGRHSRTIPLAKTMRPNKRTQRRLWNSMWGKAESGS